MSHRAMLYRCCPGRMLSLCAHMLGVRVVLSEGPEVLTLSGSCLAVHVLFEVHFGALCSQPEVLDGIECRASGS